ncbi:hypothetical protein [Actinoplanes sp. G11-F43]|uniref:hypothetical protein n=1 Tax=Actinoplanes sp. G11-F43 TaxID=3424130 RepID=UPI003D3486FF
MTLDNDDSSRDDIPNSQDGRPGDDEEPPFGMDGHLGSRKSPHLRVTARQCLMFVLEMIRDTLHDRQASGRVERMVIWPVVVIAVVGMLSMVAIVMALAGKELDLRPVMAVPMWVAILLLGITAAGVVALRRRFLDRRRGSPESPERSDANNRGAGLGPIIPAARYEPRLESTTDDRVGTPPDGFQHSIRRQAGRHHDEDDAKNL